PPHSVSASQAPASQAPASQRYEDRPPRSSRSNPGGPASDRLDPAVRTRRALADAAAFRGLRLLDKAIETVQVALEFDPQSIELRECLRDLYVDLGDRDAAIEEMLTMASIYIEYDHPDHAET